jgi:hypothetical protein
MTNVRIRDGKLFGSRSGFGIKHPGSATHLLGQDGWTETAMSWIAYTHNIHLKLTSLHKVRRNKLKIKEMITQKIASVGQLWAHLKSKELDRIHP